MAVNTGKNSYTEVAETYAPQRNLPFPVTEQRFVRGGHQNFWTIEQRDEFPMERRWPYMTCTIRDVSYILSADMTEWRPFDRGYLVLNPKRAKEPFYVVFPFDFVVLGATSVNAIIHNEFISGKPGERKLIEISGTQGSVVTFEIARVYVG